MKLLITGARRLPNDTARAAIAAGIALLEPQGAPTEILHGGAAGTDAAAAAWAEAQGIEATCLRPDYARFGTKAAPLRRNTELVAGATVVLAIYAPGRWRQGGTWDTAAKAAAAGLPLLELEAGSHRHHYTPQPVPLF